jgi:hypothetical protein
MRVTADEMSGSVRSSVSSGSVGSWRTCRVCTSWPASTSLLLTWLTSTPVRADADGLPEMVRIVDMV